MSSFAPAAKRPKQGSKVAEDGETFPGARFEPNTVVQMLLKCAFADIEKIVYKPDAEPGDLLCFKHYNAEEVIRGKTMEDWLRFSVCCWHTFRGTGRLVGVAYYAGSSTVPAFFQNLLWDRS